MAVKENQPVAEVFTHPGSRTALFATSDTAAITCSNALVSSAWIERETLNLVAGGSNPSQRT